MNSTDIKKYSPDDVRGSGSPLPRLLKLTNMIGQEKVALQEITLLSAPSVAVHV
jgi:hypothetical protein